MILIEKKISNKILQESYFGSLLNFTSKQESSGSGANVNINSQRLSSNENLKKVKTKLKVRINETIKIYHLAIVNLHQTPASTSNVASKFSRERIQPIKPCKISLIHLDHLSLANQDKASPLLKNEKQNSDKKKPSPFEFKLSPSRIEEQQTSESTSLIYYNSNSIVVSPQISNNGNNTNPSATETCFIVNAGDAIFFGKFQNYTNPTQLEKQKFTTPNLRFRASPTCHDINKVLLRSQSLFVAVGFDTGDILIRDPIQKISFQFNHDVRT